MVRVFIVKPVSTGMADGLGTYVSTVMMYLNTCAALASSSRSMNKTERDALYQEWLSYKAESQACGYEFISWEEWQRLRP